jgi:hypothetical protein
MHIVLLTLFVGFVLLVFGSFMILTIQTFGFGIFFIIFMSLLVFAGFIIFSPKKFGPIWVGIAWTIFVLTLIVLGLKILAGQDLLDSLSRKTKASRHETATELDRTLPIRFIWPGDPYLEGDRLVRAQRELIVKPTGSYQEDGVVVLREVLVGKYDPAKKQPPTFIGAEKIYVEPVYLRSSSSIAPPPPPPSAPGAPTPTTGKLVASVTVDQPPWPETIPGDLSAGRYRIVFEPGVPESWLNIERPNGTFYLEPILEA